MLKLSAGLYEACTEPLYQIEHSPSLGCRLKGVRFRAQGLGLVLEPALKANFSCIIERQMREYYCKEAQSNMQLLLIGSM